MPAQILRANPAVTSATFVDTSGATVDPGTVSVVVTNLAGETVASGNASGTGAAARTYTLTAAHTATLDTLSVAFTSASLSQTVTETVEVIGALLFRLDEARAFDGGAMANTTTYPDAAIAEARARITEQFEEICGVSFVPRYRRERFNGPCDVVLDLKDKLLIDVRSLETYASGAWTAYTADELADLYIGWSDIRRLTLGQFPSGYGNIRVGYEHGFTTPPHEIKRAALMAARYELVKSNINDRAISITTDQGSEQLWTPGLSGRGTAVHPIPVVNEVLMRYRDAFRVPVVA